VATVVRRLAEEAVSSAGEAAWKGRVLLGRHVDSGRADVWFRAALRKALPLAFPPFPAHRTPTIDGVVA
jgi:CRISPR system Cascade subunit CasA